MFDKAGPKQYDFRGPTVCIVFCPLPFALAGRWLIAGLRCRSCLEIRPTFRRWMRGLYVHFFLYRIHGGWQQRRLVPGINKCITGTYAVHIG